MFARFARFCHHCGAVSSPDLMVCPDCGGMKASVEAGAETCPKPRSKFKPFLITAICLLLLLGATNLFYPVILTMGWWERLAHVSETSATKPFVGTWSDQGYGSTITFMDDGTGCAYGGIWSQGTYGFNWHSDGNTVYMTDWSPSDRWIKERGTLTPDGRAIGLDGMTVTRETNGS